MIRLVTGAKGNTLLLKFQRANCYFGPLWPKTNKNWAVVIRTQYHYVLGFSVIIYVSLCLSFASIPTVYELAWKFLPITWRVTISESSTVRKQFFRIFWNAI
jgi:hypothetical protein